MSFTFDAQIISDVLIHLNVLSLFFFSPLRKQNAQNKKIQNERNRKPFNIKESMLFYLSSRFGDEALLTVSASPHDQESVRVNGSSVGGNKMLQLTNQSAIYLGGLPDNLTVTITNT